MQPTRDTDIISVRELRILANAGLAEFEREWKQTLLISFSLEVSADIRRKGGHVSYVPVLDFVRSLGDRGHIELIETVAEMVAAKAFEDSRVIRARVDVAKTDVFPDAESVGISILADRDDVEHLARP